MHSCERKGDERRRTLRLLKFPRTQLTLESAELLSPVFNRITKHEEIDFFNERVETLAGNGTKGSDYQEKCVVQIIQWRRKITKIQGKRKIDLVYGGGSVGLMGLISKRVYKGGFHVLGIIPKALMPIEISGETVGNVRVVADMHERKDAMAQEAEAFIALTGGYGTMEEVLEMITWLVYLMLMGTITVCLLLFDTGVEEGFIKPVARNIVVSAPQAKELMEKMEGVSQSMVAPFPTKISKVEGNHVLFGKVIQGMDYVFAIEGGAGTYSVKPRKKVVIADSREIPKDK
ncbi:unnamed protein product [Eruca vesicaria subsp. sativa]|uniref:cytokinin riboside 5'-monophosphate phosphoribohydrolase n=1 Tax=Eruca vesicaria subsp. sativa TaxID=29727 RepID=A0ABC8M6M9_ERUVS|nr:unnamed protein product [Eruca vesicaria subsp. sativa]